MGILKDLQVNNQEFFENYLSSKFIENFTIGSLKYPSLTVLKYPHFFLSKSFKNPSFSFNVDILQKILGYLPESPLKYPSLLLFFGQLLKTNF